MTLNLETNIIEKIYFILKNIMFIIFVYELKMYEYLH